MVPKAQTIVTNEDLEEQKPTESAKVGYPSNDYPHVSDEALKQIGEAEATKEKAQQNDLNISKFENLVKRNDTTTLLHIKSVKPLDFFPSNITIDINKINISKRDYFFSRHLHTIPVENIQDVFVEMTPFYATLKIIDKGFVENTIEVSYLKKREAKSARRIIQGLITAFKEGIDLASLPDEGLLKKLEVLGSAGDAESVKG